jgi:hypothetical protein
MQRSLEILKQHCRAMCCGWLAVAIVLGVSGAARAQRTETLPKDLLDVGVTEHLNEQIPLDLAFVDSKG